MKNKRISWDFITPRHRNTLEMSSPTVWRAFIGGRQFVSNHSIKEFDSESLAKSAILLDSDWWEEVNSYIDFCVDFFYEEGAKTKEDLRDEIETRIWENMINSHYVEFKEYK